MLKIVPDQAITRRGYVHLVMGEGDEIVFSSKQLLDCFDWIEQQEESEICICDGENGYNVKILPPWE